MGDTNDDRIAALEKRVDALEAALRVVNAAAEEMGRVRRASAARWPEAVDRDDAVMGAGVVLRPILAGATPEQRAAALAEGPPAHALTALLDVPALADQHAAIEAAARYAAAHALTWDDLGVSA